MSNQFLNQRRPVGLYVVVAAVGLVLFVAVGLIVQTWMSQSHSKSAHVASPAVHSSPAAQGPGSVTGLAPTVTPAVGPQTPLQLVQGGQLINGLHVDFPHTLVGAVSAATEYMTALGSTLDPDRSAAVMRLVADPSYTNGPSDFATGTTAARTTLGLPATGQLPISVSAVLGVTDYQVQGTTADQVTVLLLADYSTTTPNSGAQTRVSVFPLRMHWAAGDWKVLAPDASADYSSLVAQPGSPTAAADGWQGITR